MSGKIFMASGNNVWPRRGITWSQVKSILIEQEYGIKTKPASSKNPQASATTEIIPQVIGNRVCSYDMQKTYVDDADPWMGILATAAFVVQSTYHWTGQKNTGQLVFGKYMILPINHIENWRYTRPGKQTHIKDVISKKIHNNWLQLQHWR